MSAQMISSEVGDTVLAVRELTKRFGRGEGARLAVDRVSVDVPRGSSLGVVGESGSGKTTLANLLMGFLVPTSGEVIINGRPRSRVPRTTREWRAQAADLQIVFQDPYASLDRRQRGWDCLDEVLQLQPLDREGRRERAAELADLVGLDTGHLAALPRHLSGGQRQRLAIARALATKPAVLVLDESVAALDVSIQAQVLNTLADIRERTGLTLVVITHDLAVVRQVTTDVLVMKGGVVVERGTTDAVLDDPQDAYTRRLLASVPRPGWRPTRRTLL